MKRIFSVLIILFFTTHIFAQSVSGKITDNKGNVLPGAFILIKGTYLTAVSDDIGRFRFDKVNKGNYDMQISLIGYEAVVKELIVSETDNTVNISLTVSDIIADEVIITAIRADHTTPVAYTTIDKDDLNERNQGKDIPYLLDMTPSVVINSDAGAGVGYTTMRIRGTDMTRINVTLDGIPLNDSESHGVWWVNMPDFASSVDNIQIQRGVGTSTNGAAAFGANINFVTNKIEKEAFANIDFSFGSFNTQKYTFKAGSGLLKDHFVFESRFSKIHSDGFVDRAETDLESYYISGAYIDKNNFFKVNVFRGAEETYQAWAGIPKDSLETNRTYNPYTYDNEVDDYKQNHFQTFYTRTFNSYFDLNLALHYTKGAGYYEQFKEDEAFSNYGLEDLIIGTEVISSTDLIRRKWLDNDFYGSTWSLKFNKENVNIVFGGAWNRYKGDHFGRVIWAEYTGNSDIRHEWYKNTGHKTDFNDYLKLNFNLLSDLNLWIDLQYRLINYDMAGIHDDLRDISQDHSYKFFNPKAGINFKFDQNQNAYFSFAVANREPSRSNFRDADADETFSHETLYDYEAGYKFSSNVLALNMNLYFMDYKDQLILTGELNDVGAYIMTNVPDSYRAGIELTGALRITNRINLNMNVTYSKNKIKNLSVFVDNWDTWGQETEIYEKTDISFSPEIITGSELSFNILKGLKASFISKYVGKQFIDNTSDNERSLNPYFVNHIRINYTVKTKLIKKLGFNVFLNNVFNEQYETNAWVYRYFYGGEHYVIDGYFPQAGFNLSAGVSMYF